MSTTATSPVRFPDLSSAELMGKRAWWLVGLNILIPGSAQSLAGSRRLGRFGIASTFVLWALAIVTVALLLFARPVIYVIASSVIALWVIQIALILYAVLWVVLTVDTLRLARLFAVEPALRFAVAGLATVVLLAAVGTTGYGAVVAGATRGLLETVFGNGEIAEPVDGRYNILLLGGDAGPDRLGLRPDSISVVSIDAATGAATMIGIPRNLEQVPFAEGSPLYSAFPDGYDCGDECLISFLYTYGEEHPELYPSAVADGSSPGIEAMMDAAEAVVGLKLQYYVLIDMQGFSDLIDSLGGVTIDVPEDVTLGANNHKPIGTIKAGVQKMDGATALWYARSRYNMTDYDRMVRQRQVQAAILAQFEPANVLTKFQAVADAGAQVVKTDIPQGMLPHFVELAGKTRVLPLTTLELIPANGVVTAHPDFAAIHAMVQQALIVPTASPTPTP